MFCAFKSTKTMTYVFQCFKLWKIVKEKFLLQLPNSFLEDLDFKNPYIGQPFCMHHFKYACQGAGGVVPMH